jgi:hypothetical protein
MSERSASLGQLAASLLLCCLQRKKGARSSARQRPHLRDERRGLSKRGRTYSGPLPPCRLEGDCGDPSCWICRVAGQCEADENCPDEVVPGTCQRHSNICCYNRLHRLLQRRLTPDQKAEYLRRMRCGDGPPTVVGTSASGGPEGAASPAPPAAPESEDSPGTQALRKESEEAEKEFA